MCRTGGRRCPGCNGPTARAKHNARRRKNRAIKVAVVQWARDHGRPTDEIEELLDNPPGVAKAWAHAAGLSSEDLGLTLGQANEQRDIPAAGVGQAPIAPPISAAEGASPLPPPAPAGPAPAPRGQNLPREKLRARLLDMMLEAGMMIDPNALQRSDPEDRMDGPHRAGWEQRGDGAEWMTPQLMQQVATAMSSQGRTPVERMLLDSEAHQVQMVGRPGINEIKRIDLGHGQYAYFKPFDGVDAGTASGFGHDSAQQPMHEVAAWRLAEQLGPPWSTMVPPCVLRAVDGRIGSLSLERSGGPGRTPSAEDGRHAAFFDSLIRNQDRHGANYLVDEGRRLTLIDHGFAFARAKDFCSVSLFEIFHRPKVLTWQEKRALQRLLDSPDTLGLQGLLQPERVEALRARAEKMLAASP